MHGVETELGEWSTFFAAFAEASAALLGLLFVAVSLLASGWRGSGRLSMVINQSGIELLYPLIASLLMLVPAGVPVAHGIGLLLLSAAGLATSIGRVRGVPVGTAAWSGWSGAAGALLYGVSGVAVLLDAPAGVYGVALASFLMIVAGTVNTWDLLVNQPESDDRTGKSGSLSGS
jgi:hypothetical protein